MTAKKDFRMIDTKLFLAIANTDITRGAYKALLIVIHFSIGYHKKEADISTKTFQRMTGLAKTSVLDAVHELENKHIIEVTRHSTRKAIYSLNTLFETWKTGSLHPTSLVVKKDAKTLPVGSQNPTKTGSLHPTKTGSPVVPKKSTIYIEDNKITLKDKGEGKGTGVTISYESKDVFNEVHHEGAVNSSGAKPIKETVSTDDKIQPVPVFTQQNRDKFLKYQAWQTMAEGILGMSLERAESILDRHIDDVHGRDELLEIKKQLDSALYSHLQGL
jgi:hypothetical protein